MLLTLVQAPAWANGGGAPRAAPLRGGRLRDVLQGRGEPLLGDLRHRPARPLRCRASTSFTVWNEPNRGQFLQPQGPHGLQAPKVLARLMRRLHDCDPQRVARRRRWRSGRSRAEAARAASLRSRSLRATAPPAARGPTSSRSTPTSAASCPSTRGTRRRITARSRSATSTASRARSRAAYGDAVPIWLTEFAWRTAPQPGLGVITPARQAELAEQSVDVVRAHYPYAQMLVWFLLRDESPTSYWRSGLVTYAQPEEARLRRLGAARARERCRDATVPVHARALDRNRRRRASSCCGSCSATTGSYGCATRPSRASPASTCSSSGAPT